MRYLFYSQFLTQWGDKVWTFAAPILFVDLLAVQSLFPPTLFTFAHSLACVLLNPVLGSLIDRHDRLLSIRVALAVANGSVIGCSASLYAIACLYQQSSLPLSQLLLDPLFLCLFLSVNLFGCLAELASAATRLCVAKDWVVVLHAGDPVALASANALLHRIALVCNIIAPFFFAVVLDSADRVVALMLVMAWNAISFVPEYWLLSSLYHAYPALWKQRATMGTKEEENEEKKTKRVGTDISNKPTPSEEQKRADGMNWWQCWKTYFGHQVFFSSMAYVMLYMTVLSDGSQIMAYLTSINVPATMMAVFRGTSSIFGVLSTMLSGHLIHYFGNVKAGALMLASQLTCLAVGCLLFFPALGSTDSTLWSFLASIVLSRFGLWGFDLVQVGHMQLFIEEHQRGTLNATESSMTMLSWLTMLGLGLIFSEPSSFHILGTVSLLAVFSANVFYWYWWVFVVKKNHINQQMKKGL